MHGWGSGTYDSSRIIEFSVGQQLVIRLRPHRSERVRTEPNCWDRTGAYHKDLDPNISFSGASHGPSARTEFALSLA